MSEIDNFRPGDPREEILGPTGEACYLVWKDRPADDQVIILKDQPVERDRHILGQQTLCQVRCFPPGDHAGGLEHFWLRPVVVEDAHIGIALSSLTRVYTYQPLNRLLCHRWVSSQGNQVIQLRHASAQLFIKQAEDQGNWSAARSIRDNDEYALPVQWQRIAGKRYKFLYILNRQGFRR